MFVYHKCINFEDGTLFLVQVFQVGNFIYLIPSLKGQYQLVNTEGI